MIAGPTYASNPIDSHRAQIARYFCPGLVLVSAVLLTCAGNHSHYEERRLGSDLGY
jgi:hypothetical protein